MRSVHILVAIVLLLAASVASSSELLDRVVAVVNRHVILQSEVESAARFQALVEGREANSITSQNLQDALDRLINEQLLFGEMADPDAYKLNQEQIAAQVAHARSQFHSIKTDRDWNALLSNYGLSEHDFEQRVTKEAEVLRFVDVRLRPTARVDSFAIETYYRDDFLPKLRATGAGDVPLSQVSGRIEQILIEKRIDEMLKDWLQNLRDQAEVRVITDVNTQASVSGGGSLHQP